MTTARKLAEEFRMPVVVLSDANLATAQQPFPRPTFSEEWLSPPINQSPVPDGAKPYDWDPRTGMSERFIPGQPNGMHCLTGLAHDRNSRVAYDPEINQEGLRNRSLKLAAFQKTLKTPPVFGGDEGDLLLVGWGSTKGAIEEAVDRARDEGLAVSSTHLTFLSPLQPGLKEIFSRFDKVMTVEINYSDELGDPYITEENRRYGQVAYVLRAQTLVDVDCWTRVLGEPMRPGAILTAVRHKLNEMKEGGAA